MQKAHLYEVILVNRGIDQGIRRLERLKRTKGAGSNLAHFGGQLTLFEMRRTLPNGYFCNIESCEHRDEARFEKRHREALDEVPVYQLVQTAEERQRLERKTSKNLYRFHLSFPSCFRTVSSFLPEQIGENDYA